MNAIQALSKLEKKGDLFRGRTVLVLHVTTPCRQVIIGIFKEQSGLSVLLDTSPLTNVETLTTVFLDTVDKLSRITGYDMPKIARKATEVLTILGYNTSPPKKPESKASPKSILAVISRARAIIEDIEGKGEPLLLDDMESI